MTTYRTGNHWGVTIVRETELGPAATAAELVAVVVNGDQALAARIAALLTIDERCWHGEHCPGSGPDCERDAPLKGGHRDCADAWHAEHGCCTEPYDGDAPSGPLSAPVAAQEPPVGGTGPTGGVETLSGPCRYPECECDTDTPCGVTALTFNPAYRVARCGQGSAHGPHVVDHGPDQPRNCPGTGR